MRNIFNKVGLGLGAYWQAATAIERQFSQQSISSTQNAKLRQLIRYCFNNIKYYKEVFRKAGIRPEHISCTADLERIPILTRDQLRTRFWDFLPKELPPCRVSRTSGSTGVPVCILSDKRSRMFNSAAVIRYRRASGIPIIGRPILTPLKTQSEPNKRPHWTFVQGIHETYYLNPYADSEENLEYAKQLLTKLSKPALVGITPAIRALAYKVRDGVFPFFRPSVILTSGEVLMSDVRQLLESTFGTTVTDIYACNEASDVAWQCPQTRGYHINADNVIVEIVTDDKPVPDGRMGEVVITNLNRFAMPIIRYKNGDLAKLTQESCPCGCKLPMIAEIIGRTGQDIFLPNGKTMPWNQLKSLMTHPQVRQFQLAQGRDGALTIRYVAGKDADPDVLEALLLQRYKDLLGPSMKITVERTDAIAPAASGKSKLVVSEYKPEGKKLVRD